MVGTREEGWTDQDRLLALALTMHEDGLHSCGYPKSLAFSGDSEGIWEVLTHTCQACAAADVYKRRLDGQRPQPGEGFGVANTMRDDEQVRMWQPSAPDQPHADQDQPQVPEQQDAERDGGVVEGPDGHEPEKG